jgi:dTDP-4-amino-4,6-dideoxygalactose transaminase
MDPGQIEAAITERTKAIIPVHLYGQPADMAPILAIARKHHLIVIEDAAQAHGAEYNGQRAGSIGDLGCFSFYPGKNLGAYGEGGAVTTNNPDYARTLRMLRDWGAEKKYHHELKGFNYRMEGLQGAILGVKMNHIEQWTEARRAHAALYNELLAGAPRVVTPVESPSNRHVYHVYAIRVKDRDRLQKALGDAGIYTGIHYPFPVHVLEAYRDLGYAQDALPESVRAGNEVLSLPMYAELTDDEIRVVAEAVRQNT